MSSLQQRLRKGVAIMSLHQLINSLMIKKRMNSHQVAIKINARAKTLPDNIKWYTVSTQDIDAWRKGKSRPTSTQQAQILARVLCGAEDEECFRDFMKVFDE